MVFRAGAGPRGCPIANLTSQILTNAFRVLKSDEIKQNVLKLSEKMNAENGVLNGVESFLNNLPIQDMLCEVSLFRKTGMLASIYCQTCGLKMCSEVDNFIHREESGRQGHLRVEYRYIMMIMIFIIRKFLIFNILCIVLRSGVLPLQVF